MGGLMLSSDDALQGMGLDFRSASGGPPDPLTVSTVASIIFDTR